MNINLSLLGQAITFAVFIWFTMQFVWPPITAAMAAREKKIADGLASAKRGDETLAKAQQEAAEVLRDAKEQAAMLVDQANQRATLIVEQAKVDAREEGQRLLSVARADIERETQQARIALRQDVAKIAVLGAEKLLERHIGAEDQDNMLEQLVANL